MDSGGRESHDKLIMQTVWSGPWHVQTAFYLVVHDIWAVQNSSKLREELPFPAGFTQPVCNVTPGPNPLKWIKELSSWVIWEVFRRNSGPGWHLVSSGFAAPVTNEDPESPSSPEHSWIFPFLLSRTVQSVPADSDCSSGLNRVQPYLSQRKLSAME